MRIGIIVGMLQFSLLVLLVEVVVVVTVGRWNWKEVEESGGVGDSRKMKWGGGGGDSRRWKLGLIWFDLILEMVVQEYVPTPRFGGIHQNLAKA